MFDLDAILDEVREKYYSSKDLKRPTISWSKDYWTDFFGMYTYFNNHITISRILDDKEVTKEMISSVIYHESLHQDYPEHNRSFSHKAYLFPEYKVLQKQLSVYATDYHNQLEYQSGYNTFSKNKNKVVYILLPYQDNFSDAVASRDGKLLIDFGANIAFNITNNQEDYFYIFLAQSNAKYWIVGWSTMGILLQHQKKDMFSSFGDYDVQYQYICDFADFYLLPVSCCSYGIDVSAMPHEFKTNHCVEYDVCDSCVISDLDYINSYCEGYLSIGFDLQNINCIPVFSSLSVNKMKALHRTNYESVWLANAVVNIEPSSENLIYRARLKQQAWLPSSAMDDYIEAMKHKSNDSFCAGEIVKLCAITEKLDDGKKAIARYKDILPQDDNELTNAINFIMKGDA